MTSGYDSRGRRVGATIMEITSNFVSQVKTNQDKDGYNAVQLAMGTKKSVKKPQLGHLKKAGISSLPRWMREVKVKNNSKAEINLENLKPGQEIKVGQVFSQGDSVKVTGISKGRGFQGGVKRYNFKGGPKTHGQSDRHRAPGSIGAGTTPGRVYKGKRMAGHMGVDRVSYTGLEVLTVDQVNNLLTIKGGVPGHMGGLVIIEKQGRIKGYTPPPEPEPEEEEVSGDKKQGVSENPEDQVAPVENSESVIATGESNAEQQTETEDTAEESKAKESPAEESRE